MAKNSKDQWLKAFRKLSFRDRMILIIFSVAGLGALLVLFFVFLFKGRVLVSSTYPTDMLSEVNTKSYTVKGYNDLPYNLNFPNTDYYVSVPNDVDASLEDGASISYNNDIKLVLSVKPSQTEISDAVSASWYGYLTGQDTSESSVSVKYDALSHSSGYANSLYFDYEYGELSVDGTSYSVLTYSYDAESGHTLFISAVMSDISSSKTASDVLHRMLYTLQRYSGNESSLSGEGSAVASAASDISKEPAEASRSGTQDVKWIYSDVSTEDVSVLDLEPNYITNDYPINNGPLCITEDPIIEKVITVDSALADETVIFYVKYSRFSQTPEVMLISPYEEVYLPSYENNERDGYILYKISGPAEGDWTFFVPHKELGLFEIGCIKEQDFER